LQQIFQCLRDQNFNLLHAENCEVTIVIFGFSLIYTRNGLSTDFHVYSEIFLFSKLF